ncbi:MAG: protein-export rane protein [Sediminibacterium sp.]|jgi:preprotein translocase subunit SecG|nr:protein-export rane protein [Sediminibacterium sp.]
MIILFLILIVIASVALGFMVLVQNPKGGGLSSNVGGFSNQLMGVKQTTDVLEKGTWLFSGIIAALALFSTLFLKGSVSGETDNSILQKVNTNQSAPAPAATVPPNTTTAKPDTGKK